MRLPGVDRAVTLSWRLVFLKVGWMRLDELEELVGEIALQALRDQARGRRRDITEELYGRVNCPIAGTGRIVSPRSTAEFDGE